MKLKEMLDRDGIYRGSDKCIKVVQGTRAIRVTRNYLECDTWKHFLNLNVIQNNGNIYVVENI